METQISPLEIRPQAAAFPAEERDVHLTRSGDAAGVGDGVAGNSECQARVNTAADVAAAEAGIDIGRERKPWACVSLSVNSADPESGPRLTWASACNVKLPLPAMVPCRSTLLPKTETLAAM